MTVSARHRLEYLALRLAACELGQLPPGAAFGIAEKVGLLAYRILRKRTETGRENLAAAYPRLSSLEIEALLKNVYRNLFRTAAEVLYLGKRVSPDNWTDYVEIENAGAALDVCLGGSGAILVSGHLGNWELLSRVVQYIGLKSQALARPLDNPLLDRYLLGLRETGLQRIILKSGAAALIEKVLGEGGFISVLVDQDAGHKGAFVPFFARPASTWRTPAILSMKTGAPVLPGCCVRLGSGPRFRIIVGDPIFPRPDAGVTEETLRITVEFTSQLEGWIRRYPEQYLWLHRRWKSVPGERSIVAA